MDPHARLILYFGLLENGITLGDGNFDVKSRDIYELRRCSKARSIIDAQREHIRLGAETYVRTPQQAEGIVAWATANIPHACAVFLLVDVSHGALRFHRAIRFEGWQAHQKTDLVARLKASGHTLVDEYDWYARGAIRDNRGREPTDEEVRTLRERLNKPDPDQNELWAKALTFPTE